jgi:hypothetical protein
VNANIIFFNLIVEEAEINKKIKIKKKLKFFYLILYYGNFFWHSTNFLRTLQKYENTPTQIQYLSS